MAIKMINKTEVKDSTATGVSVVNVFGTWCGPCKMMSPILEEISNETPVFKVDVDENKEWAQEMKVQGVPTTFVFKDGEIKDTIVGFVPKEVLETRIKAI